MSRKIYNEIILQFNEETNNYDTLYEDSYEYDGPIMLAQDMEGFEEDWDTVSKNLGKKLVKEVKKASKLGSSQFDKDLANTAGKLTVYLQNAVKNGSLGESLAKELGGVIDEVFSGTADTTELRELAGVYGGLASKVGQVNQFLSESGDQRLKNGLREYQSAQNLAESYKNLSDDAIKQQVFVEDMASNMGLTADEAKKFFEHISSGGKVGKSLNDAFGGMAEDLSGLAETADLKEMEKNFTDSVESGISSGLDFIPSNAFTQALGIDQGISMATKQFSEKFKGVGAGIGNWMKKNWGKALGVGLALAVAVALIKGISGATDRIGEQFGAIGVTDFKGELLGAEASAIRLGYDFEAMAGSVSSLSNDFGIAFGAAIEMSKSTMDTARALGISTEHAAGLTGQFMSIGGHSAESAQNFLKQAGALAKSAGVAPGAIMEDMAGSSEEIATYTKGTGENMVQAAVKARSMGMALSDVAKIADGLLDFGSSLEAEMTASVMVGRQLNLQKARELALAGELGALQDEILTQVGSEADFLAMNALQRKAMADAIGISVSQLGKMTKEAGKSTAELAKMRELDISEIVSEDALSQITLLKNRIKSISTTLLGWIAVVANLGGGLGLLIPIIGALGLIAAFFWIKGKLMAITLKAIGKAAPQGGAGLAAFAASGSAAIPLLLSIAAVGASIGLIFFGLGYIFKQLPPVIDAVAKGFSIIAKTATDSILKLATPEVIMGIYGLAGAFFMLAGALVSVGAAGLIAIPAMTAVVGFTAAMTALGALGGGEKSEMKLIKEELEKVTSAITYLNTQFDEKYIPNIIRSNESSGKNAGTALARQLSSGTS